MQIAATRPDQINRAALRKRFLSVRQASLEMCEPLAPEDFRMQPCAEVSPPWWNLGHTSWFFARNVLRPLGGEYAALDEQFDFVLNSYYASLGDRLARDRRGNMTRPTTEEVIEYRRTVDERVLKLIEEAPESRLSELDWLLRTGAEHEQQHQELFYTEIKWISAENPPELRAPYSPCPAERSEAAAAPPRRAAIPGGLLEFGNLEGGWCWDNEVPVHQFFLRDFALSSRPVSNGEYLDFVEDGGYENQLLWLDNGWTWRRREGWTAPMYWLRDGATWRQWTLAGMRPLDLAAPVCHVSFYEADAFARWAAATHGDRCGARLPSEREWEQASRWLQIDPESGNQLDSGLLHPSPARSSEPLQQMFGDVWEWTSSYYEPYPGYRPFAGSLAEYNGKFMDNQRVLRGGSCVTPSGHLRRSYRNFWSAETRFQFSGFRLCYSELS